MATEGVRKLKDEKSIPMANLFSAFLTDPRAIVEATENDDLVTLDVSTSALQDELVHTFSHPKRTRSKLHYTLQKAGATQFSIETDMKRPDFKVLDPDATAFKVLTSFFSKELLTTCGMPPEILKTHDDISSRTLRIRFQDFPGFMELWVAHLTILSAAIIGAGVEGLQSAYTSKKKVGFNPSKKGAPFILSGKYQDLIGIRPIDGQYEFYIKYAGLYLMLFPERVTFQVEKNKSNYYLTCRKSELFEYLRTLFPEKFVLRICEGGAVPVCFSHDNLTQTKNVYSLLLDVSTSMQSDFGPYINHVKTLVTRIVNLSHPGDVLRITDFNSTARTKEFVIGRNGDIPTLFQHLDTLKANGGTQLFKAVFDELIALEQKKYDGVISMVVFTDGGENDNDELKKLNHYLSTSMAKPKMFTMGFTAACSATELMRWADLSGGFYTYLKTINDFDLILAYLKRMQKARELIRVKQGHQNEIVSVYEDSVGQGSLLRPAERFSIADEVFSFLPKTPKLDVLEEEQARSVIHAFERAKVAAVEPEETVDPDLVEVVSTLSEVLTKLNFH